MTIYNFGLRSFLISHFDTPCKPNYNFKEILLHLEKMTGKQVNYNTGVVLTKLRNHKGVTQLEVAAKTGIEKSSYHKIEHGNVNLRLVDLAIIAKYYEISPDILVRMIFEGSITAMYAEGKM